MIMKNTEFSQCLECGTIDYDSDIPRVGDPSASDGSLTECPHCGAIDESVSIHIVMHQVYPESTGYLAAFYAETLGQRTPLVYGEDQKRAYEALLDTYQLLI